MGFVAHYQTAQKKVLTDFLTENCEKTFSVEELYTEMEKIYEKKTLPGKSTVYRLIQQMTEEGIVKRTAKENSRKFVYQIAGGEHCAFHLHMKCMDCGKILHMNDDDSLRLMAQVFEKNRFSVDEKYTVLVGRCCECKQ
ncbi:MAG: Fur family transcriptional regulator [Ruminococcaceae bacterium]|nr:Fur family transcriptional regulator [Oscillospiraceae bacterium]